MTWRRDSTAGPPGIPIRGESEQSGIADLSPSPHALRGSAADLGAGRLTPIAAELEQLGRDGTVAGAEQLLERARLECARVLEALQELEQAA